MIRDDFLKSWFEYLPLFISEGSPSEDTLRSYHNEISAWLKWCNARNITPFEVNEFQGRLYLRELLSRKYSKATVALKIAACKAFYRVAVKLDVVPQNPFGDIKVDVDKADDTNFVYYSTDEISQFLDIISQDAELTEEVKLRNMCFIMLMAVEGLRVVEVHRMNDEDINFKLGRILIHGKGHDAYIYPCEDTLRVLQDYLSCRALSTPEGKVTPCFVSVSWKSESLRITRAGIRWAVNQILIASKKKKRGSACHALRHSCGTNLYQATKDLRLVQETLRQENPNVTARYAHVVDRINNRSTEKISPFSRGC